MATQEKTYPPLREVKVTYSDGTVIETSMAAGLSNQEIQEYFAVGRVFNLGNAPVPGDGNYGDNMQTVASVEILA